MKQKRRIVGLYYPTERLQALPITDQETYLASCQIVNEVSFLSRQMLYAFNVAEDLGLPVKLAQDSMGYFNMRMLAGRIVEGFNFVKQNQKRLRQALKEAEYGDFQKDYDALHELVGNSNCPIKKIRHKFAFHSNAQFLRKQLQKHPKDEFVEFMGENNGNTLFHGADLILLNAVIESQKEDGGIEDLQQLQRDIMTAANALSRIAMHSAAAIFQRFYPDDGERTRKEWWVEMDDIKKIEAPFFAYVEKPQN